MSNYSRVWERMLNLRNRLKFSYNINAQNITELKSQVNQIHLELAYAEQEWISLERMLKETEE